MSLQEILFGFLVIATQFIEAVTGFGSTVMALPFAIALSGVAVAVPVLSFHTWLFAIYVAAADFKKILWRQYAIVMLFVVLGLPIGMWAFSVLPETALRAALALFMIAVSINGIVRSIQRQRPESPPPQGWKRIFFYLLLFLGGIIHGAFATGGPLLIIYVTLVIKEKGNFRATMCAIWLSLNSILLLRFLLNGDFTPEITRLSLLTLPFLLLGVILGNLAHKRIPDRHFTYIVYIILFLSGCVLAYSTFSVR